MVKSKSERVINWPYLWLRLSRLLRLVIWPMATVLVIWIVIVNIKEIMSLSINHDVILGYVNLLIWPVFAFTVLFVLRPYLPTLASRIDEAGFAGARIKFKRQKAQQEAPSSDSTLQNTKNVDEPISEADNNAKMIEILQSDAIEKAYEQIYRQIFGTQLDLLKRLRLYENGLKENDLIDIFLEHKDLVDKLGLGNTTTFMNFVQYLKFNALINYNPETGVYYLTWAGLYFLVYLEKQNIISDFKSL